MTGAGRRLAVVVDGVPLPDAEARAFWERFSAWMEEHRGDLAGFAAAEGFSSVHPGIDGGCPVLQVSRTAPQRPYSPAHRAGHGGGSSGRHKDPPTDRSNSRNHKK